ncbi:MAG: AmpG family muropeptide MFS transporter [Woeseiaceae bacterium]
MVQSQSFREAIVNKRMLICAFTGFSSGLPLYVVFQLVPGWLRVEGIGLAEIGFISLVQLPYTWKFLWSPVMDRYTLPFLGRRRGWMLVTQIAVMLSIAALGFMKPALSVWVVAYLAAALAFFSASQDIVLDAYRRELLPDIELGLGNTIHVQTYRLSGLIPGALAFILADHLPWHTVFTVVAAFMVIGIGLTLVINEPETRPDAPKTLVDAVVKPFFDFFNRKGVYGGLLVLAFMFLYKLGDSMATTLQTPFFVDLQFTLTQIGTIAKTSSLVAAIVGGVAGGVIMIKLGINRALWLFGLVQITSILGLALLSVLGNNPWMLGVAVAFEYLGVGLGTSAFVAFMARETNPAFAATQFALFSALTAVPRTLAGATTGVIVESVGWTSFFFICTIIAVPGMLLLLKVAPWNAVDD